MTEAAIHRLELREQTPECVRGRLAGEIDSSNSPLLLGQLLDAAKGRRLLLDLSDLEHLDSSGMAMLHAVSRQTRLELIVAPKSIVARALSIIEFHRLVPIHNSVPTPPWDSGA